MLKNKGGFDATAANPPSETRDSYTVIGGSFRVESQEDRVAEYGWDDS